MKSERIAYSFGSKTITAQLERRDRRTLSISVTPECEVEVVAPLNAPIDRIEEKLRKRTPWILKQIGFFEQFHPTTPPRRYVSGETHRYLGRQYMLTVRRHIQETVKLYRGRLMVQTFYPSKTDRITALVEGWYHGRAQVKFEERLAHCVDHFPDPNAFTPPKWMMRTMSQRWGSMTRSGTLILNRRLIAASVPAIDYVITHELCHIRHPHHGPEFYALLSRVMPDWEARKRKLERELA